MTLDDSTVVTVAIPSLKALPCATAFPFLALPSASADFCIKPCKRSFSPTFSVSVSACCAPCLRRTGLPQESATRGRKRDKKSKSKQASSRKRRVIATTRGNGLGRRRPQLHLYAKVPVPDSSHDPPLALIRVAEIEPLLEEILLTDLKGKSAENVITSNEPYDGVSERLI